MLSDKDKEYRREYIRKRRLDPEYRKREYDKNRIYRKTHRPTINANVRRYRDEKRKDPEYRASESAHSRASYQRLRKKLFDAYGGACACCGENTKEFLELDHINGGGSKHFEQRGAIALYRDVIREHCPSIYRILCANCNRGRSRNGGVCPHQLNHASLPV